MQVHAMLCMRPRLEAQTLLCAHRHITSDNVCRHAPPAHVFNTSKSARQVHRVPTASCWRSVGCAVRLRQRQTSTTGFRSVTQRRRRSCSIWVGLTARTCWARSAMRNTQNTSQFWVSLWSSSCTVLYRSCTPACCGCSCTRLWGHAVCSFQLTAERSITSCSADDSAPGRRADHFMSETDRVTKGAQFWQRGNIVAFGRLMNLSGRSSAQSYEVPIQGLAAVVHGIKHLPTLWSGCQLGK